MMENVLMRELSKCFSPEMVMMETGLESSSGKTPFPFFLQVDPIEPGHSPKETESPSPPWPLLQAAASLEILAWTAIPLDAHAHRKIRKRKWKHHRLKKLQRRRKRQWN